MPKVIIIFALLLSALFAEEELETFPFLGITASYHQIDFDSSAKLDDNKETLLGFRYGKQTLDWRTMFTLLGDNNIQNFSVELEIDKILLDDMFGYPEVRPYLGATIGYTHNESNDLQDSDGVYYGGAFGFLIYITDNIDADISYHYNKLEDIEPLSATKGVSIGIHYFY